jgi:hypothetical protein
MATMDRTPDLAVFDAAPKKCPCPRLLAGKSNIERGRGAVDQLRREMFAAVPQVLDIEIGPWASVPGADWFYSLVFQ